MSEETKDLGVAEFTEGFRRRLGEKLEGDMLAAMKLDQIVG